MPIHLKFRALIERPVDAVCSVVTDLPNMPNWFSIKEVRNVSDGPLQVGSRFQIVSEFLGKERGMDYQVTEYEPCKLFAYESNGSYPTRVAILLKPSETGTEMTFELVIQVSGLAAKMIKGPLRKQTLEDITRLVESLENGH